MSECKTRSEFYVVEVELFDCQADDRGAAAREQFERCVRSFLRRSLVGAGEGGARVVDLERLPDEEVSP